MKISWKSALPALGLLCVAAPHARSQIDVPSVTQSVTGAGALHIQAGDYTIRGTLGQTVVGSARPEFNDAALGFWHPLPRTAGESGAEEPTTGTAGSNLRATPNPFAGETEIGLRLSHSGHISVVLYNLLGQPIRTLLDAERPQGEHTITLRADDLASGRYTLILNADNEQRSIPLLLVR